MADRRRGAAVLVVRAWRDETQEPSFRARVMQVFDVSPDESLEEVLSSESVVHCSTPGELAKALDDWLLAVLSGD